jgi:metal-sulfur cluster biosynthetic enzyme
MDVLGNVQDPDVLMSIVDLGLVYRVEILEDRVEIDYTLTFPGCPLSEVIERDILAAVETVTDLSVQARLVWEPVWNPDFMSDEAKISLGYPV